MKWPTTNLSQMQGRVGLSKLKEWRSFLAWIIRLFIINNIINWLIDWLIDWLTNPSTVFFFHKDKSAKIHRQRWFEKAPFIKPVRVISLRVICYNWRRNCSATSRHFTDVCFRVYRACDGRVASLCPTEWMHPLQFCDFARFISLWPTGRYAMNSDRSNVFICLFTYSCRTHRRKREPTFI